MPTNHTANLSWGYPSNYPCMFSPTVRSVCSASLLRVCSGGCTCCCTSRRRSSAGSSFASPHEDKPLIEAAAVAKTKRMANLLLILLLPSGRLCTAEATLAPSPLTVTKSEPSRLRLFPLLAKGVNPHQGPHPGSVTKFFLTQPLPPNAMKGPESGTNESTVPRTFLLLEIGRNIRSKGTALNTLSKGKKL